MKNTSVKKMLLLKKEAISTLSEMKTNLLFRLLNVKTVLVFCMQLTIAGIAIGQNTSYNSNANPIGGNFSTAFGLNSLRINGGNFNTANGCQTLYSNTTGYNNTANGYQTLYYNMAGCNNTANGDRALYSNTTGSNNTANGHNALAYNVTGYSNTAEGFQALFLNKTGSMNTALGDSAGYAALGSGNVFLGYKAGFNETGSNKLYIAGSSANLPLIYGDFLTGRVGIGTVSPNAKLDVSADILVSGLTVGKGGGNMGDNTALGNGALYSNTTGRQNTATGDSALYSNTIGRNNLANGFKALYSNTTGTQNTAIGNNVLYFNSNGYNNTANGAFALFFNTTGNNNSANGSNTLTSNTTGSDNTAIGFLSLKSNTTGIGNTANGSNTLSSNITGSNNTACGYGADVSSGNLTNATAIGSGAIADASNKVFVGNTAVNSIGGQVGWTNYSDGRIKKNIKENVPGLAFINLLKPVTYNYNIAKENELLGQKNNPQEKEETRGIEKINFTGFVAQDVDAAAQKIGYDFSGVDKTGIIMGLRYSEFVVPLVKGMQEQQKMIDDQQQMIQQQQQQIDELKKMISDGEISKTSSIELSDKNAIVLNQNIPNPFDNQTTIGYSIPQNAGTAQILFYDAAGRLIKTSAISSKGKGRLTVFANDLSSGIYSYSLIVDGKLMDAKKLIKQ